MTRKDWLDRVLELSEELLALAEGNGDDDEHLVLEGVLRDSAFKILRAAQVAGRSTETMEPSADAAAADEHDVS